MAKEDDERAKDSRKIQKVPNKLTDWTHAFREQNTDLIKDREMVKNLPAMQETKI